ncbi:hypothetical protein [Namhaeicola litoreus]|uniref:Uncharacterized protein n=1 Tax=Namhaeicola litoreus TaxID=1052145 RepID=A0ABW3XWS0_9FLAO
MSQLSKAQIENLYQFTRQHFVEWYDLQTELVDHLANDIEVMMENEKDLSFEKAKYLSFKKFGVFGFSDIIEKKQNSLSTHYWKLVGKYFLEYLKLPKILFTLFLIAVSFSVLKWFEEPKYFMITFFATLYGFLFHHLYRFHKMMKHNTKITQRKWLFEHTILNLGGAVCLAGIPIQILGNVLDATKWTDKSLIIYSTLMIVVGLITFILIKIVPKKIFQEMSKQFPEYKQIA